MLDLPHIPLLLFDELVDMIVEKPAWLRHEGLQIFSIDVQPSGQRFATAGGDYKVRIWDMKYLSPVEPDSDSAASKLLATLRDHFGAVNCIRWARKGRFIASGSDDKVVLIHERRPGSGTTEFGSGEPPDVENWKVTMTLRGHTADVVDLGWYTDDSLLASCSLDNTVRIWRMSDGANVAILEGHSSLVKGVAWDPIGSFLASQSDDKSIIIWQTSDWGLVRKIEGHWEKSVGSTFFRRLDWSPCGHFVTTTNGFQKPRHSAPVLERGVWTSSYDFVGHSAPIVAVRFNHSLFRKKPDFPKEEAENGKSNDLDGSINGDMKSTSKDLAPYNVIAMGSQDCSITVWTTTSVRPVFVGKHFFSQSVVDLSWSPDGYSLFCCSLDGSVAAFHFEVKELGYKVMDSEMEDLKKNRYGGIRSQQTSFAESPAQLMLESLAVKQWSEGETQTNSHAQLDPQQTVDSASHDRPKLASHSVDMGQSLNRRNIAHVNASSQDECQPRTSSPVRQQEYRRPDGRRRIIPEPVTTQFRDDRLVTNGKHVDSPTITGQKRDLDTQDLKTVKESRKEPLLKGGNEVVVSSEICESGRASITTDSNVVEAGRSLADAARIGRGLTSVQKELIINADIESLKGVLSIVVSNDEDDNDKSPVCLEARPFAGGSSDDPATEIICSKHGEIQWKDKLSGRSTVIAGNTSMWAVGCDNGFLQVYTKAGRRALPSMMIGSSPVFLDCNEGSKLLLLTRNGALYLWDCVGFKCLLKESVLPLLTSSELGSKGPLKVSSARISRSGAPLIVLESRHAFLFHVEMQCWQRIADDQFHGSSFLTSIYSTSSARDNDLALMQATGAAKCMSSQKWNRTITEDKNSTRSHLESQIAVAVALNSPNDYQHFLLAYVRFLAREADEIRLRELCMDLLGPPHAAELGMDIDNASVIDVTNKWEATILGIKKHDLLKSQVLPAMASNRSIQRLLNEMMDLVSEHEAHHS